MERTQNLNYHSVILNKYQNESLQKYLIMQYQWDWIMTINLCWQVLWAEMHALNSCIRPGQFSKGWMSMNSILLINQKIILWKKKNKNKPAVKTIFLIKIKYHKAFHKLNHKMTKLKIRFKNLKIWKKKFNLIALSHLKIKL